MTTTVSTQRRVRLVPDIWNGAVLGSYAPHLGIAGAVTQAGLCFVPVVGTLCAVRDYFACRRKHDRLGATLNLLAAIPVVGGLPKTAAVLHGVVAIHRSITGTEPAAAPHDGPRPRIANPLAVVSLLLVLATPVLLFLPGNWVLAGLAAPLVAVLAGHAALGRAHRHPGARARVGMAITGVVLGYLLLLILALSVTLLLIFGYHVGPFSLR